MTIKVLVVDDSALMRRFLRQVFEAEPDIEVDIARDGKDALDQIRSFNPDVVTLDINMPVMDGLTCLSHIMAEMPRPVIMVSSLTEKGALATFEALELGAIDYVPKPGGTVSHNMAAIVPQMLEKVRMAAGEKRRSERVSERRVRPTHVRKPQKPQPQHRTISLSADDESLAGIVLIGVSTGGPRALEQLLPEIPVGFPHPILVCQHMPANFTQVFANRLNGLCPLTVREVDRPTPLVPGEILIGKGDADLVVGRRGKRYVGLCVPQDPNLLWHPSVNRMVTSAMECFPANKLTGVLLTGMGDDGASAMKELHQQGGQTIAEAEDSAVVFGMPRELIELKGASAILPIHRISRRLQEWCMDEPAASARRPLERFRGNGVR